MPAAAGSPGAGRPAAGASAAFCGTSADVSTAGTAAGGDAARIPGEVFRDCADCPEMVVVPAGAFRMGCGSGQVCGNDELPVHEVRVEAFALGRYKVLVEEIRSWVRDVHAAVSARCGSKQARLRSMAQATLSRRSATERKVLAWPWPRARSA